MLRQAVIWGAYSPDCCPTGCAPGDIVVVPVPCTLMLIHPPLLDLSTPQLGRWSHLRRPVRGISDWNTSSEHVLAYHKHRVDEAGRRRQRALGTAYDAALPLESFLRRLTLGLEKPVRPTENPGDAELYQRCDGISS